MAVLELGGAYASQWDFSQTLRRFMAELAAEIGETVNFAVLDGSEIAYVLRQEGRNSVTTFSTLREDDLGDRLKLPLPTATPRSLSTVPALMEDLAAARARAATRPRRASRSPAAAAWLSLSARRARRPTSAPSACP
jgi:hypothetical protein